MVIRLERPALVVIDVQNAIDDPSWGLRNNADAEERIAVLLEEWRRRELPIFHVRHDSAEPESTYRPGQPGNDFKAEVEPLPHETVVVKRTNSAFIGTDLARLIEESGSDATVYTGVITNNSVEATVRMSGNFGYRSFVVSDATATVGVIDRRGHSWSAEDVHQLALANMDGEYATVVSTEELLAAL